jgi:molybdopterin synthase sulfur carrier subunit
MPLQVTIPTPLRGLTNNQDTVPASGATIGELIADLEKNYPGIGERLLDAQGQIRRFVNVYVNGEDVRFLQDQQTPIKDTDEISIVPAIAGG